MINFEITVCEECNKVCFCDFCDLPGYSERKRIKFTEETIQNIKILNSIFKILKDKKIDFHVILGGIGEPGLLEENDMKKVLNLINFDYISTTGEFLEKGYFNFIRKPILLHIADYNDEFLIQKYRDKVKKVWTILSKTDDLDKFNVELYDKVYLEGNISQNKRSIDENLLKLCNNIKNMDDLDFTDIQKDRDFCKLYMQNIVINLTRNSISMCSCYNSFISIDFSLENLKYILTDFDPFKKFYHINKCDFCFRNCKGCSKENPVDIIKVKRKIKSILSDEKISFY